MSFWKANPWKEAFRADCSTGVGELDQTVPNFSSRFSVFNGSSDLEHRGDLWDVIAQTRGREENKDHQSDLITDEWNLFLVNRISE